MRILAPLFATLIANAVQADVARAVDDYILPSYAAFAQTTKTLRDVAASDCTPTAVAPAWQTAFDAWLAISHLHFGPVETDGRSVIIAFWPDERGATPRTLSGLIADEDPVIATPDGVSDVSAAARGLYALEYLLFDPDFAGAGDYECQLVQSLTADLASIASEVADDWNDGYAATLRDAGAAGNTTFLTEREGIQILFTALLSGLEFDADKRLGRPLGTFERPRANRAESRRSERSQRNLTTSLHGLKALKDSLSDAPTPVTDAAFAKTFLALENLDDPRFAGVEDPQTRFKLEIIQQSVQDIAAAAEVELSALLGVEAGFNSADGD